MIQIIKVYLASTCSDGIFTGRIRDYKDAQGMLASAELFRRISTAIEACQSRIDALNESMKGDWKVQLMKDLSEGPFAMLDQVAMNRMDKPTVLTLT